MCKRGANYYPFTVHTQEHGDHLYDPNLWTVIRENGTITIVAEDGEHFITQMNDDQAITNDDAIRYAIAWPITESWQ